MLNPQFVAGEHGLFGGHKSKDIRTFLNSFLVAAFFGFLIIMLKLNRENFLFRLKIDEIVQFY